MADQVASKTLHPSNTVMSPLFQAYLGQRWYAVSNSLCWMAWMAGAMYASMRLPHILLIFLLLLAIWRYKMFSATEMAVKLTLRLYFFLWDLLFLLFLFVHWDLLNVVAMYQREFFFFLINSNSLIAKITDVQAHCHYYFLIYQFLFCFFAFLRSDKDHVFKFFRLQVSKICVNSFNLFAYIFFNIVTFFFFFFIMQLKYQRLNIWDISSDTK